MQTRRAALLTIAGAAASPLLSKQTGISEHAEHAMAEVTPALQTFDPVFFDKADYAVISRLADLIVPRTDTPGAVDAHVPFRIDQEAAKSTNLQARFKEGLALLNAAAKQAGGDDFTALTEAQQVQILTAMGEAPDSPQGQFFGTIKSLTVDWYYRSEEGLVQELGFHGNTYRSEFPGCTHPEHWPQQESK